MSQGNIEIARAAIDAANRRDWDAAFKDCTPRFTWDNSRAMGPDNAAVFSLAEAREFFQDALEMWESARVEIDGLTAVGDHVVMPHTVYIRGRDGIELKVQTTWLFTIRDLRIEHVCLYQQEQEALDAAGAGGRP